ncbi:MAG TPA: hypothetical protein VFZ59_12455 [Verrucomicrobiae bacterium]|nr:hypothetical protein [Verrucomicrobiae bacterium]
MNDINLNRDNSWLLLSARRLPARLNVEQTASITGFQPHDIPTLVKAGLLKPLGSGPRNSVKYFAAIEVQNAAQDRKWLDRATRAVSRVKSSVRQIEKSA